MSGKKLNLAICGFGRFALRRLIPAIEKCNEIELAAIVTRSNIDNIPNADINNYLTLENYLNTKPDGAVYIASPNYLHSQQAISCLKAGLHVICEKPMATNYRDCLSMLNVAQSMNLHLQVGHMLRFSPAIMLARKWIKEELLGEINFCNIVFHYDLPESNRSWVNNYDFSGGGVLMDSGIHCIDVIRLLFGNDVTAKSAMTDKQSYNDGIERSGLFEFTIDQVKGTIKLSSTSDYKSLLEITGSKGILSIENFAATWESVKLVLYSHNKVKILKQSVVDVSRIYSDQLKAFAENIKNVSAESLDFSAAENVKTAEIFYSIASFK